MSTFSYTARDQAGQETQGTKEASSKSELAKALREEGHVLTSAVLMDKDKKKKGPSLQIFQNIFKNVSLMEKILFARHLSVMLAAGLSLNRGLQILSKQTKGRYFAKVLQDIEKSIRAGQSFSESLIKYPHVFNNLFVSMMKVGEASGNLEEVLKLLADQMKKEHDLRSRIRGALVYPAVIVVAMIGIGILMMVMVVPKLTNVFEELDIELPTTTKMIVGFSNLLKNNLVLVLVALVLLIILIRLLLRQEKAKMALAWFFLHLPVFSGITRKINIARIARTLSSLIEGGVQIVQGLRITQQTLGNFFFRKSLDFSAKEVQKGKPLSSMLDNYKHLYPPMVTQMIQVGEETGSLVDILKRLAEFYEEEVALIARSLSSIIEPILMIIIGAAVGFFAMSMIQPIYSMMGAI